MMPRTTFSAPWSTSLKVLSFVATAIILIVTGAVTTVISGSKQLPFAYFRETIGAVILFAPFVALLLTVRGYTLEGRTLKIKRLFWETEMSLEGLTAARFDPDAVKGSLRLFGNGGFFSFSGIFRNKTLGNYRAWATDQTKAVILTLGDKTWVVTPGEPERFVETLETILPS